MPYEYRKEGKKHCVGKPGGETLKCYDTKREALDYLAALEINVEDASYDLPLLALLLTQVREGKIKGK